MHPGGRPTLYKPEYAEQAGKLASLGAIDIEIADFFGVTEQTISNWKRVHPKFFASIKLAKANADNRVEQSLYKRAMGFEKDAVKIFCNKDGDVTEAGYREYYPPDTVAGIFWLKNRRPTDWRDKSEIEVSGDLADSIIAARKRVGK